jgi:deazaflavin-dependent oxidoreductase (nitroreductase family)
VRVVKNIELPTGLSRFLFRLPIHAYQLNLGWLFGRRLLLLNHTGRVTGQPRQVALEVAEHDPTDGSYVVASGWGPGSAWYRNILSNPDVTIQVGTRTIPATAVPLSADEGAEIFACFGSRHRLEARFLLPWMLGLAVDGSDADYRAVGRHLPFVRFVPRA